MNAKKKKISVLTDTTASVQKEGEKKNASSDRQFSYTFNFIWRRSHFRWNRNRSVGTLRIYFFFFCGRWSAFGIAHFLETWNSIDYNTTRDETQTRKQKKSYWISEANVLSYSLLATRQINWPEKTHTHFSRLNLNSLNGPIFVVVVVVAHIASSRSLVPFYFACTFGRHVVVHFIL